MYFFWNFLFCFTLRKFRLRTLKSITSGFSIGSISCCYIKIRFWPLTSCNIRISLEGMRYNKWTWKVFYRLSENEDVPSFETHKKFLRAFFKDVVGVLRNTIYQLCGIHYLVEHLKNHRMSQIYLFGLNSILEYFIFHH